MSDNPIVSLGELSKPATVLIEKISDAVGGIFKPFQIVRTAKAEAEADKIRADSQIVIQDIHRRAMHRFLEEEAKKQKNMEEITQKALPDLNDDAKSEDIENDWIVNFFDKCRLISDSEMQQLWSRVLSGEANTPSMYSKRTINFLSSFDKSDAKLFTNLIRFGCTSWVRPSLIDKVTPMRDEVKPMIKQVVPLIYDVQNDIYNKHGIDFSSLNHLDSIGLIHFDDISGFTRVELPQKIILFHYYGQPISFEFQNEANNRLYIGTVILTKTGQELAPICGSSPDQEFYKYICNKWKKEGLIKENEAEQDAPADA